MSHLWRCFKTIAAVLVFYFISLKMKNTLLLLFGVFITPFLFSQILTVNSGSSISIASSSSVAFGGLEVSPADTYVISGENAVSRSDTPIIEADNSSVSRVYSSSALLSGFTGTLTFSYLEEELNGITEGDLVLELQADDDSWTSFQGTVNEVNNTVSYTFNEAVSFKAVTASAADATLTIEDVYPLDAGIFVYPNPTANRIYIQGENILQAELFDLTGRKIITTNQKQIDLGNIPTGSYILQVTAQNNKTQSFKIIKQ